MKRCLSICITPACPFTPKKPKKTLVNQDDIFSLSFLIDFSAADVERAWDMGDDLEYLTNDLERRYKFKTDDPEEGLIETWFSHMSDQKRKELSSLVFNLYSGRVKDPTDPLHIVLVDLICMAYGEPIPNGTFGYIIKFAEYKKRFRNGGI